MPVSDRERAKVLARSRGYCELFCTQESPGDQIVHSEEHQGMGGAPEDAACNQADKLFWGCAACQRLTHEVFQFGHVDLAADPPIVELYQRHGKTPKPIDASSLWFFRAREKAKAEAAFMRLQGRNNSEPQRAADYLYLYRTFGLLDDGREAPSFAAYISSQGWDVEEASRLVGLCSWLESMDLVWSPGVTAKKLEMVREAVVAAQGGAVGITLDLERVQETIAAAADLGLRELGVMLGLFDPQSRYFVAVQYPLPPGVMVIWGKDPNRASAEAEKALGPCIVTRVGKIEHGGKTSKGSGKLLRPADGKKAKAGTEEIPVTVIQSRRDLSSLAKGRGDGEDS